MEGLMGFVVMALTDALVSFAMFVLRGSGGECVDLSHHLCLYVTLWFLGTGRVSIQWSLGNRKLGAACFTVFRQRTLSAYVELGCDSPSWKWERKVGK